MRRIGVLGLSFLPGMLLALLAFFWDWSLSACNKPRLNALLGFVSPLPAFWLISGWSLYVFWAGVWPWFGRRASGLEPIMLEGIYALIGLFLGCASVILALSVLAGQAQPDATSVAWLSLVVVSAGLLFFVELFLWFSTGLDRRLLAFWLFVPFVLIAAAPTLMPDKTDPPAPANQGGGEGEKACP